MAVKNSDMYYAYSNNEAYWTQTIRDMEIGGKKDAEF